eukprot:TRINITY_DN9001_c0_g1_i2.p1 TRINITY_DN9001_c0_g1~~TRINITY_DN9001_c0_g1_i2.p1  ORF type:complete len:626 (+),score=106.63 TRINITY_DN9001_c0_g1_i2:1302-3179(+)
MNVLIPIAGLVTSFVTKDTSTAGLLDVAAVDGVLVGVWGDEVATYNIDTNGNVSKGATVSTGSVDRVLASSRYVCAWGGAHVAVMDASAPPSLVLLQNITMSDAVTDVSIDDDTSTLFMLTDTFIASLNLSDPAAVPVYLPLASGAITFAACGQRLCLSTPTALLVYDLETNDTDSYPNPAYKYLTSLGNDTLVAVTENGTLTVMEQYTATGSFTPPTSIKVVAVVPSEGLIAVFTDGSVFRLNMSTVVETIQIPGNTTAGTVVLQNGDPVYVALGSGGLVVAGTGPSTPEPPVLPPNSTATPIAPPLEVSATVTLTVPYPVATSSSSTNIALYIIIPILIFVVLLCCGYAFFMYRKGNNQTPTFEDKPAALAREDVDAEMSPVKPALAHASPALSPALGPGHAPPPGKPARVQDRAFAEQYGESGRSTPVAVESTNPQNAPLPPLAKKTSPKQRDLEQPVEIDISYSHFEARLERGAAPAPLSPHSLTAPLLHDTSTTGSTLLREGSPRGSEYNELSPFYSPPVIPNPSDQNGVILDTQTGRIVMSIRGSPSPMYGSPQRGASLVAPPNDLLKDLDIAPKELLRAEVGSREDRISLIRAKHLENERLDKILELARVGYDVGGLL